MNCLERTDDFDSRRKRLQGMSEDELHVYFWNLVNRIIDPLIEEARTHTTPSIERSVLLRMGFSSFEAKGLVTKFVERDLLGHGGGRLVLELAKAKGISIKQAGQGLLEDLFWEELG